MIIVSSPGQECKDQASAAPLPQLVRRSPDHQCENDHHYDNDRNYLDDHNNDNDHNNDDDDDFFWFYHSLKNLIMMMSV